MNYRDYFRDKKVAIVGLGENFKALGDIEFLVRSGATVTVIDTRPEKDILPHIKNFKLAGSTHAEVKVMGFENVVVGENIIESVLKKPKVDWREKVTFSFGKYKKEDFENKDLIVRDIDIPSTLPFLKDALNSNIPVEVAESLFVKLAPPITLIGVTGTCGKTTVAYIINEILKKGFSKTEQKFYFIDPYKGFSPLSLLGKIKRDDIVLLKTGRLLLKEFERIHLSPHIAVITNLYLKHLDVSARDEYLEEKSTIFKHQTYNNFFIANDEVVDFVKEHFSLSFKAKILRTGVSLIAKEGKFEDVPYHMRENMALAARVAEVLKVSDDTVMDVLRSFKGVKGRVEYVKKIRNALYYNDSASKNAISTLTALKSFSKNRNTVLMFGGADVGWSAEDMADFMNTINQYVHTLVLLPGSGTLKMHKHLFSQDEMKHVYAHSIYDAVRLARDNAGKDDIVMFSPGFPAYGLFQNETERGDHFVWTLRSYQ